MLDDQTSRLPNDAQLMPIPTEPHYKPGKKPGQNLTPDQRAWFSAEAWRLRVELGLQYREIAKRLGISLETVARYLKRERKLFGKLHTDLVEEMSKEHIEALQVMLAEAIGAWERSKQPLKIRLADGSIVDKERLGDPRYLEEARQIMADMRKVVGADAPDKQEVVETIILKTLKGVSMEDI